MKVFFLPGLASGKDDYRTFLQILEKEHDVYTIDMYPYSSVAAAAEDAVHVLERNSILLGYCFGARVALFLNAFAPEKIRGNIFFTPMFVGRHPWVDTVFLIERTYYRFFGWNSVKKLSRAGSFVFTLDPETLHMLNPPDECAGAILSAAESVRKPFEHYLSSVVPPVYVHVEIFDHVAPAPAVLLAVRSLPQPKRIHISMSGHHLTPITRPGYAADISLHGLAWIESNINPSHQG